MQKSYVATRVMVTSRLPYKSAVYYVGMHWNKFLAEAKQNETLGRRPNTEHSFSHCFPHVGLFWYFFSTIA